MASKVYSALGNMATPGMSRLRGFQGQGYQSASVKPEDTRQWDGIMRFAELAGDVYQKVDQKNKDKADERSNEIIRKLTPEQRREAIKNGTLLYQDDPYAMQALRFKTGRNAAFQIDDDVMQKVREGQFRSRQELDEYRHSRLQEGAKKFAEEFGLNEADEDFQRGFNDNITERNISLYGTHDSFLSDQAQKGALVNSKVELNGVLNDPDILRSPDGAEFFQKYIDNGRITGSIPSDSQVSQLISASLQDVVQREGGAQFLMNLEDKKVTLNGTTSTFRELLGDEQWNMMKVNAQHTEFTLNAKRFEKFSLGINNALNQADPSKGWEQLQAIKEQLDEIQPGEEMTPERQQLINAQQQLQNTFAQKSAATAKELDKQQKSMNKQQVIEQQFNKRLAGEYVSTAFADMPTNENTGEFTHSDMVNFANNKLQQIEQMDLTDEQKDAMKLKYLRADSKDGAFRTAVGQMVSDAGNEWAAAIINGKLPENTVAMDNLRRMRNTDPDLVAALYPDKADLFVTMDMMDKMGVNPQMLIDGEKYRRTMTKEMQYEDDKSWASLKNNSESPELSRLPSSLDSMARKVYDAVKYQTGNSDMAMQQVDKFLKDSTTTFTSDDVDGSTIGVLPKSSLQVTDDPKSWEQGRDILDAARKGIIQTNPWITNKQLTIVQSGNGFRMIDTTGNVNIYYDNDILRREYQRTTQAAEQKARDEAIKNANKRAPIAAATKAREAAGERVRAKKKTVPKFIYGGGE